MTRTPILVSLAASGRGSTARQQCIECQGSVLNSPNSGVVTCFGRIIGRSFRIGAATGF